METSTEEKETARVEAFSDGVFAIAITLLVLELKVPRELTDGETLTTALGRQWPSYIAFVTSFATIGIMWINHHRLFTYVRRVDHGLLLANLLLLLGVTVVPFPTALIAEHHDARLAAMAYSGTFVGIAIFFNILWRHARREQRLLGSNIDLAEVAAIDRQYAFGPLLYVGAFALCFVSVGASVLANLALAIFFALPPRVTPEAR